MAEEARETRGGCLLRLLAALLAAFVLVFLERFVAGWVGRNIALLLFGILLLALVLLVAWLLTLYGPKVWRFARSVASTVGRALPDDPEVRRLGERHPRFSRWLADRVRTDRWNGWYLTLTVFVAALGLFWFAIVAQDLIHGTALAKADPQVSALLRTFRGDEVTRVMWVATVVGGPRLMIVLTLVASALFWLSGRRRAAIVLAATSSSAALVGDGLKLVTQRARPLQAFALIKTPSSFSFPSGHALGSFVFFGLVGLLVARALRNARWRGLALVGALVAILLVGVSRIYLGVHWMTDVLGSWALGLAWVAVGYGTVVILDRYRPLPPRPAPLAPQPRRVVIAASVAVVSAALVAGALADPLLGRVIASPRTAALPLARGTGGAPTVRQVDVRRLPVFSETLNGTRQEPIGIVFVGTRRQLDAAFIAAGWRIADRPSAATLARAGLAALQNKPYPTAPVTPDFLGGSVQNVAYEKAYGTASVRRRHHVRAWATRFTTDGRPIWVATASLDVGLEVGSAIPLPTHRIAPDIDAERDFVVRELTRTGRAEQTGEVRVSAPMAGVDAEGDRFFTRGMATVLAAR